MRAWVLAAMLTLGGCYVAPGSQVAASLNPNPPPPPPRSEVIPAPPVSEVALTWEPGHWDWTGAGYVWTPGHYVDRHGVQSLYQPGYWTNVRGPWEWVPAHWL